jgi:pimeloyl-ACP methyl ester carboxylesterase
MNQAAERVENLVQPRYLSTPAGQIRIWCAGDGPSLVVLPGLVMSAEVTAHQMAQQFPGWHLTVVELPGIGGSAKIPVHNVQEVAGAIFAALNLLGITKSVLLSFDLATSIAKALSRCKSADMELLQIDVEKAKQWVGGAQRLPSLKLRQDGTHLVALYAHFRNCLMLDSSKPSHIAPHGSPLLTPLELDTSVVAAAVNPTGYSKLWTICAQALETAVIADDEVLTAHELPSMTALKLKLDTLVKGRAPFVPSATPQVASAALRNEYLQTPSGRVHLRRVGHGPKTLFLFQSAPGSAEPLELLMKRLAKGRTVIACDYLDNGDSAKAVGEVDINSMAHNAIEVADALNLSQVDLFGTHTGALVALEFAILQPHRVGRIILEAPPLLDQSFTNDILENYLPPIQPDRWGTHVLRAWNMRRDMFLFWPWYRQSRDAARSLGLPDLRSLHDWTVGLLKSGRTYHRTYGAAFKYNTRSRLPLLGCPALICAGPADMLVEGLAIARLLAPEGTVVQTTPATVWYPGQSSAAIKTTVAIYDGFLRGK